MSDKGRKAFMKRSTTFQLIYKLHTVKYYYDKKYINDIDSTVLTDILKSSDGKMMVTFVWECCLCCLSPSAYECIKKEHLNLFMKCLYKHYEASDKFLNDSIRLFLWQIAFALLSNEGCVTFDFFFKLEHFVEMLLLKARHINEVLKSKGIGDVYTKSLFLISRGYLALRKVAENNPLHNMHEKYVINSWDIIKNYICNGCEYNVMYYLMKPYYIDYDAAFVKGVHYPLMVAITESKWDQLNRIRLYTKILLKMYLDHCKTLKMKDFMVHLEVKLLMHHIYGPQMYINLKNFVNAAYAYGEVVRAITKEKNEDFLLKAFNASMHVITKALYLLNRIEFKDTQNRKSFEQIFVTYIQIMKTCTKMLHNEKEIVLQFLVLCEQVVCITKLRKITTVAYETIFSCRLEPFYEEIVNYLIRKLDIHLEEIENVALNSYSGDIERLLLTFKTLAYERTKFILHFEKMLNVTQGHQELHLTALKAICSDAELKDFTAPYLVQIFKKTIGVLSHHNLNSGDAAMGLIEVLANRFMGMKSKLGERPLSAYQAFERYPELAQVCHDVLNGQTNKSKIGMLAFIGDSPSNSTIFGESFQVPRNKIVELMSTYGLETIAGRAFVMTIKSKDLYHMICDTIKELQNDLVTPDTLLFMECFLERLINSGNNEEYTHAANALLNAVPNLACLVNQHNKKKKLCMYHSSDYRKD